MWRSTRASRSRKRPPAVTVPIAVPTTADRWAVRPVGRGGRFDPLFTGGVTVVDKAVAGRSVRAWLHEPNVSSAKDSAGECVVGPGTCARRRLTTTAGAATDPETTTAGAVGRVPVIDPPRLSCMLYSTVELWPGDGDRTRAVRGRKSALVGRLGWVCPFRTS